MNFEVKFSSAAKGSRQQSQAPFHLAVLADFSGRASRGLQEPVDTRRVLPINCDNFERVLQKLDPTLMVPTMRRAEGRIVPVAPAQDQLKLRFASLDDFHPDPLGQQVPAIAHLVEQRRRLVDPATSAQAATELGSLLASRPAAPAAESAPGATAESNDQTMARLLGGAPERPAAPAVPRKTAAIEQLIRNIVSPSVVAGTSPQQTALLSALDLELAARLRCLLHSPDFQALEAAWRGLDLLVRNFGAEENLKLLLLDISKAELAADLAAQESPAHSGLARLVRQAGEDLGWAAWLGLYSFGDDPADVETLGRLAAVAAAARAPFLSGASPHLVGCDSFAAQRDPDEWQRPIAAAVRQAWQALREKPEATFVGLALPRFLLRQPYGQTSDPIVAFPFEELPSDSPHESYLWGNPAILCGYLLADAFRAEGWELQIGGYGEVNDLPVHQYRQNGETAVKPCAEAWLSERAGETILARGLIPVLSIKGRDAVRIPQLRSLGGAPFSLG